jgi:hypothetical protein
MGEPGLWDRLRFYSGRKVVPPELWPWFHHQLTTQPAASLSAKASGLNALVVFVLGLSLILGVGPLVGLAFAVVAPALVLLVAVTSQVGERRVAVAAQKNGMEYRTQVQREADARAAERQERLRRPGSGHISRQAGETSKVNLSG